MDKCEAYKIVYEDMMQVPLLRGEDIDTRQADYWWIHGIHDVMERVATGVSSETREEFNDIFHANIEASHKKYDNTEFV